MGKNIYIRGIEKDRFDIKHMPEPNSGCWIWLGANINGKKKSRNFDYGSFKIPGKTSLAHRASWIIYRGDIPGKLSVLHKCDNPTCVNPDHLFLGTQKENVMDCVKKGRHKNPIMFGADNPAFRRNQ